ncbi:MAG: SCO family protein [Planctomycetota bacterium]
MNNAGSWALVLVGGAVVGAGIGVGLAMTRGGQNAGGESAGAVVDAAQEQGAVSTGDESAENAFAGFRFASFELVDQDGSAIDQTVLDGRVTAVNFFFTSCPGPCRPMTTVLRGVQDWTRGSGLRLMSISVDGNRDTPEIVRAYGESFEADPERWRFVTGDPAVIGSLVSESLDYELREQDDFVIAGPGGVEMANILHPTRVLLVGPDRSVIGVYAYNDPEQISAMIVDAQQALEAIDGG